MPTASSLKAAIEKRVPGAQVTLVPGGGGDFIVQRDGEKLWDKNAEHSGFPDEAAFLAKLGPA